MIETMLHEPWYESGTCEAPEIGVYAGWIAQPGSFAAGESGRNAPAARELMFAGECFPSGTNAPTAQDGRTRSRRSVLCLYERLGEDCVIELNGLFSGLLIDRPRRRAMLFNDRYGVERVYVHEAEDATYFASEAKALLRVLPATRTFDQQGVAEFLAFGCPLAGRTLFQGIRTLDGGSLWIFQEGPTSKKRYFTPSLWEGQPPLTVDEFQTRFESTFRAALPRYFHGESRIGISLTGGLDSRMIMACLPDLASSPVCYTFGPLRGDMIDARLAERVAAECGLEHRLLRLDHAFLTDFGRHVDRTIYATDGALGPLGAHEIYLNAQARQLAPLRLTGNFGSEVLRSMSTFKSTALSPQLLTPEWRQRVSVAADAASADQQHPVTFAAFQEVPTSLFGIMAAAKSQVLFRTPYLDNDLVALTYRAPMSVRQSATSALRLIEHAHPRLAHIPTDRAVVSNAYGLRYAIRRLVAEVTFKVDYIHQEAPPGWLLRLPGGAPALDRLRLLGPHKFLPYRLWFQQELASYVTDVLSDPSASRQPFWNHRGMIQIVTDHVNGRRNAVREINAVLTLAAVQRLLLTRPDWTI